MTFYLMSAWQENTWAARNNIQQCKPIHKQMTLLKWQYTTKYKEDNEEETSSQVKAILK